MARIRSTRQGTAGRTRSLVVGLAAFGVPAGVYWSNSLAGIAFLVAELGLAVVVVLTALFGTTTSSERAFRLLRWLANRTEPAAPEFAAVYRDKPRNGGPPA